MPHYFVHPVPHLAGAIRVPGDKSISHRALLLGSLAEGVTQVRGFLESEDCLATLRAMRALGVQVERTASCEVRVHGVGLQGLAAACQPLDMGNSGTAMRLMAGLLAGQRFDSELIGDASLMNRPMERAAAPLRQMAARVATASGKPPVKIGGGARLKGIRYELPVASAQVKSAVLLAGLYAEGETTVIEPAITRDHTERMLLSLGCEIGSSTETVHREIRLKPPRRLNSCSLHIPGDFSSAAFFIVAGCISRNRQPATDTAALTIEGVGVNPTRTGLLRILDLMGADVRAVNHRWAGAEPVADIEVRPAPLQGIQVPEHLVPLAIDEFPALFIAAACAEGETTVTGAHELRIKESDRIAAMAEGLQTLGVACEVLPDGIRIQGRARGSAFHGGTVHSHGDHRIAMSFAIASLRAAAPIHVLDTSNVATSFPDFPGTARAAGMNMRVQA